MKKFILLFLGAMVSTTVAHAGDILEMSEDNGISLQVNAAIEFAVSAKDGGYSLENEIFWQNGKRVMKAELNPASAFCSLVASTFWSSTDPGKMILPMGKILATGANGKLSADGHSFTTVLGLDGEVAAHLSAQEFFCESGKDQFKETTTVEVKAITGGALGVVASTTQFISSVELAQMFLENPKGYQAFKKAHRIGPILEKATVEIVSDSGDWHHQVMVEKYVIISRDCLGTDVCEGTITWTVTATTESDGYSYSTQYQNSITRQ